jgi:tetratricopeptide (TPR) repeat protein
MDASPSILRMTMVASLLSLMAPCPNVRALPLASTVGLAALPASPEEKEAPLSQEQALEMLQAGIPSSRIEAFARKDGIDFKLTPDLEQEFRKAGATPGLIQLLKKLSPAPAPPQATEATSEISSLLDHANDALTRKDYAGAVTALTSIVALHPDFVPAWYDLGFAYTGLNEPQEAIKAYQKAVELDPNHFLAQSNLGSLLMQENQPEAALGHLQKAVATKPENARAHLNYARALAEIGQPGDAEKEFHEAARLDPQMAIASLELGQLELQQKRPEEALAAFQTALAVDPKSDQAELGAALAAEDLNDSAQAAAHLEKYLAANPDDLAARLQLGRVDVKTREYAKADDIFEDLYRRKPDLTGLTAELGDVNALIKKLPEAEKYYRLAVASNPSDADLHRALGEVLQNQRKFPEAEKEFRNSLQLDSHNRAAAIGLAFSLNFQKNYEAAIPLFEKLATFPDADPTLFFVLATCYDHLRQVKPALANYETFLKLSNGKFPDQEWQATQRAKLLRRELEK